MKTVILTPNSSVKSTSSSGSTSTTTTMDGDPSENRDSCYFPGCRKDANCNCEMCLASINATLDLMPMSIHRGSRNNNFSSFKSVPKTPISFNPSFMSTPKSDIDRLVSSPPLHSTARTNFQEKVRKKKKKRNFRFVFVMMKLILGLILILGAEFGFSWVVSRILQPKLSPEIVREVGEKSKKLVDLNERLGYLAKKLQGFVGEKVSNCSSANSSTWEIVQDGLLLKSHCKLYESRAEKVTIWGWPLQTAGLLTAEFSPKSFTIMSGRVTEWSNGQVRYLIREANTSWKHEKWSASALHLDQNTWILEYQRSALIDNGRLLSAVVELIKVRMMREVQKMKQTFWLFPSFYKQLTDFSVNRHVTPT